MDTTAPPALDVDLFDAVVLASPWDTHARIREHAAVVWLPRHEVWATGRDAVVRDVLVDPSRYSSALGVGLYDVRRDGSFEPSAILELDPPEHTRSRRVMNRLLSPRALRRMRADFEVTARRVVDDALADGDVDGIADLAWRFPFTVLPDVVGLRVDGREHLAPYSRMYFDTRAPDTDRAKASRAAAERDGSREWVREQCRREHLTPGRFGDQLYRAADVGEIDPETAAGLVRSFLGAGIDTTVLVLGTMLHQLALRPDAWRAVRDDHRRIRAVFDEAMRWAPAAALIGRTTTGPVAIDGVEIGARQKIVCLMTAANRDPRRWDRPDEFDIGRDAAAQLGFGIGPHFCVGHALARLEADVLMTELLTRVERIEVTGEPEPETINWLLGLRSLPLRLLAA